MHAKKLIIGAVVIVTVLPIAMFFSVQRYRESVPYFYEAHVILGERDLREEIETSIEQDADLVGLLYKAYSEDEDGAAVEESDGLPINSEFSDLTLAETVARVGASGDMIGFSHSDSSGTQTITLVHTGKAWMAVYHIDRSGKIRLVSSRPIDADFSLQLNATSPLPDEIREINRR